MPFLIQCDRESSVFDCAHNKTGKARKPGPSLPPFSFLSGCGRVVRLPHPGKPCGGDCIIGQGHMLRFPKSIRPFDEIPRDLRRGEFDAIPLCCVALGRDRKFHLVKPNVFVRPVRLLCAEADCKVRGIVVFAGVNNAVAVLFLPQQSGKVLRQKLVDVQRQFTVHKLLCHFIRRIVRVKNRFRYFNG